MLHWRGHAVRAIATCANLTLFLPTPVRIVVLAVPQHLNKPSTYNEVTPICDAPVPPELEPFVMQRHCFLLRVKQDRIEEYKARHAAVWPEMLQALSDAGWRNYSLFLRGDGLLVGYFETEDLEAARAAMSKSEVNARWQADMAPFFEKLEGSQPDQSMRILEEVFHLD